MKKSGLIFRFLLLTGLMLVIFDNLAAQKVSLSYQNTPFETVLNAIRQQTGLGLVFSEQVVDLNRKVSINVSSTELTEALKKLVADTNIAFEIKNQKLYLVERKVEHQQEPKTTPKTIKGVVKDKKGETIIGATVWIPGTNSGTITNIDGQFTLNVQPNAQIKISYIGYSTQTIGIDDRDTYNIVLVEDSKSLDDVVVVGYGTQRRALVTSAISKVGINEGNMRNVLSPSQLLAGRVAGVTISSSSGNLGSGERMIIRGASSLSAGNEPLYVVDGVPIMNNNTALFSFGEQMSSLAALNLTDIESIEVLKDAASAAIYGSRATNGVVLITTKSGKEGKSEIKVNLTSGFSKFANVGKIELVDTDTYIEQYNEGVDNYNTQYGYEIGDSNYRIHISNPFKDSKTTNWMDYITQNGTFNNADVSVSGGNAKTKYYIGGNYTDQKGVIRTNKINKVNLKAKVSHEFTDWLEVGANSSGNYIKNNQVPGADMGSTIVARALEQRPFDRPFKPNGEYYQASTEVLRHNPVQILNEQVAFIDNFRYLGDFYALLKAGKFTYKYSFSTDMGYVYDYKYYNKNHPYGMGLGRIVEYTRFLNNIMSDNILTYSDKFKNISLSAMLGHSFQKQSYRTSMLDGNDVPSPSFDVISSTANITAKAGNLSEFAMESYFGRATVSYFDKYIFTGTLRTDGSSKFAPDTRWGWFPSVSFGWNVSEEDFMKNDNIDLKFRLSYGQTGNQASISNYAWQAELAGGKNYGGQSGIATTSFGNKELTWEKADQLDMGIDLSLLKGKVNLIFDLYQKNTKNLLYDMPVQATSGTTSIITNIGSIRNRGVEFTLNTHFKLNQVDWLSQFNISANKNVITALLGDDAPMSIGGNRALKVGKELGTFYLFKMEGIYQYDGEIPQPLYDQGVRAGDVKWHDADNNGLINDTDRQIMGSSNPDYSGGWNNSFKYKGLQLDIFFNYMYGNDVYAQWKANGLGRTGGNLAATKEQIENRWTGPGTTNKYPRAMNGDQNNTKNSDRFLEDGSFIRLRTLSLSYNFGKEMLTKIHLKNLRIFLQADNLFLLTDYSGWDPEVNLNLDPRFFGVDNLSVPQPRSFSMGANISF